MYYQNYEDYMRAVLGYANNDLNYTYDNYYPRGEQNNSNMENLYPDIYRIVNPVVEEVCDRNRNNPITDELVKNITDEIYSRVEKDTVSRSKCAC